MLSRNCALQFAAAMFPLVAFSSSAHADIYQWEYINPADPSQGKRQSTTLAPDGAGVDAVRGANLAYRNLTMAYLIGADLTENWNGVRYVYADLTGTNLSDADLTSADLSYTNLAGAKLRGANLTHVRFTVATLTNADFTDALVTGANFGGTTSRGFTASQLYSTASYQAHNLTRIQLSSNDLSGWSFAGQNLTYASFRAATLTGADFQEATLTNVSFEFSTLTDVDFAGQNLTNVNFQFATLTDANFTDADVRGASFYDTTSRGFTPEQLYSTASYRAHDLTGIGFWYNDLSGWNFAGQNLTDASFHGDTLTDADFTGAEVRGAYFGVGRRCDATSCFQVGGIELAQLYSTASYEAHNLRGINLSYNNLAGGNFAGQNLANAGFGAANLTGANFREANLTNTGFGAFVPVGCNLFAGECRWQYATLTDADLTAADARGAFFPYNDLSHLSGAATVNLIWPDGHIKGLDLDAGRRLVVRDHDHVPITIDQHLTMGPGGTLRIVFEANDWGSTISFAPGMPVALGGTLELTFADAVNLTSQVGRTLKIFDWTGVTPTGAFNISSPHRWDLSNLYTTGEVTLTAIPEPSHFVLAAVCVFGRAFYRRRRMPCDRTPSSKRFSFR
jgi:uncharacterized protein YjbI with pentapeptide repeats